MAPLDRSEYQGGRRLMVVALLGGLIGWIGLAVGFLLEPRRAFFSYLLAFNYVVSVALGLLVFLMAVHAAGAKWPVVVRRFLEAGAATMPLFVILFVPLLFGLATLFPWVTPEAIDDPHLRELVVKKLGYLKVSFFIVRSFAYLLLWAVVGVLLRWWSVRRDRGRGGGGHPERVLSALALPALALTLSFASFDWLMSLTPSWYSTMFGFYYFAGGFVAALSLLSLLAFRAEHAGLLPVTRWHYYALGRLLLAFTIFWAYIAFFQYMIIWLADKPDESRWYLVRTSGSWGVVSVVVIVTHFVVPFFALLSYDLKQRGALVAGVAVWILAAHYIDLYWVVIPTLHPDGSNLHWLDPAALLAVAGPALALGTWQLRGHALLPLEDPHLEEGLRYQSP